MTKSFEAEVVDDHRRPGKNGSPGCGAYRGLLDLLRRRQPKGAAQDIDDAKQIALGRA